MSIIKDSMRNFNKNFILFILFWVICGTISITNIQLPYYDWFNYHYYNVWAFFNNRYDMDFMAANYRSYFIPFIDIPTYFLFYKLNTFPKLFLFLSTWDSALALLLTYKIGEFIFNPNKISKIFSVIWSILFVAFSPIFYMLLEFSMNDIKIAVLCLLGLYILFKNLFEDNKNRYRYIFLSGALIGSAGALKLNSVIYVITVFLCLIFMYKRIKNPIKTIAFYSLGIFLSFLAIALPWYFLIYYYFKNPIFPYMNDIFHSSYANVYPLVNLDFCHILPRNLTEFIFYPFCWDRFHFFGSDENFYDPRFAVTFISLIILIPFIIKSKEENFLGIIKKDYLWLLILYVSISYYMNTAIFGTYRYIASTSLLLGFIVFIACYSILKKFSSKVFYIIISILLILTTVFTYYGNFDDYGKSRRSRGKILLNINDMNIMDNSYVILLNEKTSFVIPFQNPEAHYISLIPPKHLFDKNLEFSNETMRDNDAILSAYCLSSDYYTKMMKDIMEDNEQIYIMYYAKNMYQKNIYMKSLDYYSNNTRQIENCNDMQVRVLNLVYNKVILCEYNLKGFGNE